MGNKYLQVLILYYVLVANLFTNANQQQALWTNENRFIRQPENVTIIAGKRLLLKCKPNVTQTTLMQQQKINSTITFQWFKDNKLLDLNSKTAVIYKDGTLELTQMRESDSGMYKCLAKYRKVLFESRQGHVKVIPNNNNNNSWYTVKTKTTTITSPITPPQFHLWPEDKSIEEGDEIMLECLALNDNESIVINDFSPLYKYKWLKDGVALNYSTTTRIQLMQGNNLKIENIRETDTGTYTCQICHQNECDERSGLLKVLVPPRFIQRPSNVNATLKSDAEFECLAYGVPMPTIQWFKNGEPIYPSEYFQFNANQANFKILGIIGQDEGYYQCLASNELNTIQSVAQLVVEDDDDADEKIADNSNNKNIKLKKATSITPLSTSSSSSNEIDISAPTNLRLVKAKSRQVHVEWEPPAIMRSEKQKQISYSITVRNNNNNNNNDHRQRELNTTRTSMVIDELAPDTLYEIQVSAVVENTRSPHATLDVHTDNTEAKLPTAPIDFRAEFIDLSPPLSSSSSSSFSFSPTLRFKWRKPSSNANNIAKYRLYYKHLNYGQLSNETDNDEYMLANVDESMAFSNDDYSLGDPTTTTTTTTSSEKYLDIDIPSETSQDGNQNNNYYEFLLEDLLKYSAYRFRLVALDKHCNQTACLANPNYAELFVETPSDVPDGAPEQVQVEAINTTAILVQWQPPALDKRNGLIVGYKIAVKENEKQVWNANVDSEPLHKSIADLLPGQKYSVRVTAKTINGTGPASEWSIVETFAHEMDETRAPSQPLDLQTEPTDKSIVVRWQPPADYKRILVRKYVLKYGIGFPDTEIALPSNRHSHVINNLTPSSQYVLSLRAINNAGYGMEMLKDFVTKRKSALGDNESLFPPLNVQAVAISSQSVELRWTDWHLKPEEIIPDDRYYVVRYNQVEKTTAKFKNATERNVIVSDLRSNTLYDFAVRLVIGRRESDWSMTTSQMTMESTPAPRNVDIKSGDAAPTSVIISWQAPSTISNNGYVISYLDELSFKENPNNKWKQEYVSNKAHLSATIHKLKLNTIYYFKIQARNNRAYGASSPTIIFKTPNSKGEGGGKIFIQQEEENNEPPPQDENNEAIQSFVPAVSNKKQHYSKPILEMNMIWIVTASVSSLVLLFVILLTVFACKRTSKRKSSKQNNLTASLNSNNYEHNSCKMMKGSVRNKPAEFIMTESSSQEDHVNASNDDSGSTYHNQQQKLLTCNTNFHNNSRMATPIHSTYHHHHTHHQPLLINNPNHMMMTLLSNTSSNNNENEFYAPPPPPPPLLHQRNDDEDAIAAANAAFNAPFSNSNLIQPVGGEFMRHQTAIRPKPIAIPLNNSISSPNNNNTSNNSNNSPLIVNEDHCHANQSLFVTSAAHRKSFKNLPIATATLISSNMINNSNNPDVNYLNNHMNQNNNYFMNQTNNINNQKLLYTARPYIIDNQVSAEYTTATTHSPTLSSHSSQPPVYDKIGVSTKSLLQPLKSFGGTAATMHSNQIAMVINNNSSMLPSTSISIPNTPAKCLNSDNFIGMTRSPAKRIAATSRTNNANKSSEVLAMMGGGENIYEKKSNNKNSNNEELLKVEMANLEGIMKDLTTMNAQQFEC